MDTTAWVKAFDSNVDDALTWLGGNAGHLFEAFRDHLRSLYDAVNWVLKAPPSIVVCALVLLVGWRTVGLRFGLLAALGMATCDFMGLWPVTMDTLGLVITATVMAIGVAFPLGVLSGFSRPVDRVLQPALDLVQTLPPYVYLLPSIALLGYGPATALIATVIVAIPPTLRLTALGIRMTPPEFVELGQASGMTAWQMFFKIRLPFAVPSIMAGINQSLMMAFGMVVIAGIVGSGGLGETIYGAIRTLDIAKSIDATIAIVVLTMVLDRITQSASTGEPSGSKA